MAHAAYVEGQLRVLRRWHRVIVPPLLLLALAALVSVLAAPAKADTAITNSSTSSLFVLDRALSPYTLDHDFHVYSGGFLLVGEGIDLRVDNGAAIYGDGGSISVTGSPVGPARVVRQPGGNATTWGGFILQNGSTLTIHNASITDAAPAVRMNGIANLDVDDASFAGCLSWCVQTAATSTMRIRDSSFADGSWGIVEQGAVNPAVDNVSFRNFSAAAIRLTATAAGGAYTRITILDSAVGVEAISARSAVLSGLTVNATGYGLHTSGTGDILVHNSSFLSTGAVAVVDEFSNRYSLRDSRATGAVAGVSLANASAAFLYNNLLTSPAGTCLQLSNITNVVFRGTALSGCGRSIAFGAGSAPSTADADRSNTVDGRPWIWISNAVGVELGMNDDPGFVLLSSVTGANLTDLRLRGAGLYIFGSSNIRVERVLVEQADTGLTAIGTYRLEIKEFTARAVDYGIVVRGSTYFGNPSDIDVNHSRIDGATLEGAAFTDVINLSLHSTYARGNGAGVSLTRVDTALLRHLVIQNGDVGLEIRDSVALTVVDCVFEGAISYGVRVTNSTGLVARSAFLDNIGAHASSPSSPGFTFYEAGGGNYWSGFTAPNANGDAFYDTPYNFTDGTGQDVRPRVARFDYAPAVVVLPPVIIEVGVPSTLDASYSFDDFSVATVYWSIDVFGKTDTGSGPTWGWAPNRTGNFTVVVDVVDSFGATDGYEYTVSVRDRTAPILGPILVSPPQLGGSALITLPNATDNDRAFPAGATVAWLLQDPHGFSSGGIENGTSFSVGTDLVGNYSVTVTLRDAAGNAVSGSVLFTVTDTVPPEVEFNFQGQPDLAFPFVVDASQTHDPAGLNVTTVLWEWSDSGAFHNSTAWPAVTLTFHDSGNHTVTLTLCDLVGNCGGTSTTLDVQDRSAPHLTVLRILVTGKPTVELFGGESAEVGAMLGEDVVFEIVGQDAGGAISYTWDFGDGTTGQGDRVAHRYRANGGVTVTVTMTDNSGNANATGVRLLVEGGGIFGTLIPGGNLGALLLFSAIGSGVASTVLLYRKRAKRLRGSEP